MFGGTKLQSTKQQLEKVYTVRLNKEMGIAKRQSTLAAKKQEKVITKNNQLKQRYASAEAEFQAERARRIEGLFGAPPVEVEVQEMAE